MRGGSIWPRDAQFAETDKLLGELRGKYGEKVAMWRAKWQWR